MINEVSQLDTWLNWRWQLRNAARSPQDLVKHGVISADEAHTLLPLSKQFKTLITPYYLSLIDQDHPQYPIRLQAIPQADELLIHEGERSDPIGDRAHSPTPLLVHRYPDRALLFPTYECPMFCRYCFRKEALNEQPIRLHRDLEASLQYLNEHPEIEEVILSGGDPLMISNERMKSLLDALVTTQVRRLRIHTRTPVTLPQRIDHTLIEILSPQRLQRTLTIVSHFNHPKELTSIAIERLQSLKYQGITLLNQSVLLKGVNDQPDIMRELLARLGDCGVSPYYLHHPDLTIGTQHLRISIQQGLRLYQSLRGKLSGHLIPRYVIEIPGGFGKVELDSHSARYEEAQDCWWLRSPLDGREHRYHDLA